MRNVMLVIAAGAPGGAWAHPAMGGATGASAYAVAGGLAVIVVAGIWATLPRR